MTTLHKEEIEKGWQEENSVVGTPESIKEEPPVNQETEQDYAWSDEYSLYDAICCTECGLPEEDCVCMYSDACPFCGDPDCEGECEFQ